MLRRLSYPALGLACLAALIVVCFGAALFRGEQFAYRDAGHFYYPLYQRVEQEWDAGRLPLWEMEENAGMPLLGNPTAAVLYPGKIIYRLAPSYAWGARLYVVAHVALAVAGMYLLMRSWGTSRAGSGLSALSYGFGGPVLFQYCNIIFLVGAAWVPFGLRAADRWVRLGRRWAIGELAVVLALQALGGDPQAAYLTALCAAGYAVGLTRVERRSLRLGSGIVVAIVMAVAWIALTLLAAHFLPGQRPRQINLNAPPKVFPWTSWVSPIVLAAWGLAGLVLVLRAALHRHERRLLAVLIGLGVGSALALALAAAQLVPVAEFSALSMRSAEEGAHDYYPFSLEPYRVLELVWPNVFGTHFTGNRAWLFLIPPTNQHRVWVASLYQGGIVLALALAAFGFGGEKPWRGWLSAILVVSVLGSLGSFAGPLWWARHSPEARAEIGPHDPPDLPGVRFDAKLRDGDGSPYWLLATGVPGFGSFRYPSKLLTFTTIALAGLAGLGWDRAREGRRRPIVSAIVLCIVSIAGWAAASAYTPEIIKVFQGVSKPNAAFGPFDAGGAVADLRRGFEQGTAIFGTTFIVLCLVPLRPRVAGALALCVLTLDLAAANSAMVRTVPQSLFEGKPRVIQEIEKAEEADPSPGPYRIHRMPAWSPLGWLEHPSPDRVRDFVDWERGTIQPKYGLPFGVEYTLTEGTMELYDYHWFFGAFPRTVDANLAGRLGVRPGKEVVYFSRRGFDLWNTRYFVLPMVPGDWNDPQRGYASFLIDSERIHPKSDILDNVDAAKRWAKTQDVQIYRNTSAFPRAWVVHRAEFVPPITGQGKAERQATMESILFQNDALWHNPDLPVLDFRDMAIVETDDIASVRSALSHAPRDMSESVVVRPSPSPELVVMEAALKSPGLVVLADVFYPGWELEVDGKPQPIIRANRLMRGALVPAGTHRLVYRYRPRSLVVGAWMSLAGSIGLALVGGWAGLSSRARVS